MLGRGKLMGKTLGCWSNEEANCRSMIVLFIEAGGGYYLWTAPNYWGYGIYPLACFDLSTKFDICCDWKCFEPSLHWPSCGQVLPSAILTALWKVLATLQGLKTPKYDLESCEHIGKMQSGYEDGEYKGELPKSFDHFPGTSEIWPQ